LRQQFTHQGDCLVGQPFVIDGNRHHRPCREPFDEFDLLGQRVKTMAGKAVVLSASRCVLEPIPVTWESRREIPR
jgi:hypothetical protein